MLFRSRCNIPYNNLDHTKLTVCRYFPEYPHERRCEKAIILEATTDGKQSKENNPNNERDRANKKPDRRERHRDRSDCKKTDRNCCSAWGAPLVEAKCN